MHSSHGASVSSGLPQGMWVDGKEHQACRDSRKNFLWMEQYGVAVGRVLANIFWRPLYMLSWQKSTVESAVIRTY